MKRIIISNGFSNFPLRFIAEGLHKKGYKITLITGIYPSKKIIKFIKFFNLNKFEPIQRIINRKVDLPDRYIHSFFSAELLFIFARITVKKVSKLNKIYKFLDYLCAELYQKSANKIINQLPKNKKYIYLCRAGYGGVSLLNKNNLKIFVQHNNVHPKIMSTSIKNRGKITKNSKFNDKLDGLFLHIKKDLDNTKNIISSGQQAAFANNLYFKKYSNYKKKIHNVDDQVPSIYLNYLKKKKINKKINKNTKLRIFYLGTFTERKGGDILMDIIKKFDPNKIELSIITNGFDLKYLNEIKKFKNKKNLHFFINSNFTTIIKKMLNTHVYLFPSYSEGLARTPIEALACGNYLVTSKIFTDFSNKGFRVSFLDQTKPSLWLKKINQLSNNHKLISNSFINNHKKALKYYSNKNFINSYIKIFKI